MFWGVAFFIWVLFADSVRAKTLETEDVHLDNGVLYGVSQNEKSFFEESSMGARRGCWPSEACTALGGYCIKINADCSGIVDYWGCSGGKNCKCCIPEGSSAPPPTPAYSCTELGGTEITYDEVNYCLRRDCTSWDNTTIFCAELGMTMAEPEDPNGLATHIISLGLSCWYWLAGRGDGSNQIWLNGTVISNSDPLWSSPPNTSPNYCLALITCSDLERTLITYECDSSCGFDLCQDKKYPSSIGKRVAEAKYVDNPDYNLLTVKPDTDKKYQSNTVKRVAEAKFVDNPDYNLLTVKPDTH